MNATETAPKTFTESIIVYPDGTKEPGITFKVANGFVSRVVSVIANSNQMGCIADARRVCEILNREAGY